MDMAATLAERHPAREQAASRRRKPSLLLILGFVGLGVYLVWTALPILWLVLMSLKNPTQQFEKPPLFIFPPTLDNYKAMFSAEYQEAAGIAGLDLPRLLRNSVVAGVVSTALAMALAIPAAHALARQRLRIHGWFIAIMLFTRMLPPLSLALPLFLISRELHVFDSLPLLIIVYAAVNLPFAMYMLIGFFEAVPMEIEEAGMLDGLSRFGCLVRLALPLVLPGLAATAILSIWVTWTDYQFALVLTTQAAVTMPVGISQLVSQYSQLWGIFGAAGIVYAVPVVAFCLIAQRYLVTGLTMGAVKG
jgi:multiple sugar transport system permease protein